jgi:hypothetical protein
MNTTGKSQPVLCPACHHSTGHFLAEVSVATGQTHYKCFACSYTWIADERPSPSPFTFPRRPTQRQ